MRERGQKQDARERFADDFAQFGGKGVRVRLELIRAGRTTWGSLKSEFPKILSRAVLGLAVTALMTIPAWPQQAPSDLANKSIEDLMSIEVTSASRREEKISQTAAAIYVITQEDIRRSGLMSIPELLRMVPGLDVAHIDAGKWAISARGFNGRYADKLLVLIDGRSLYSSVQSGVLWEVQDVMLEDIERIEVIRGPGATLWGAGAVNGIINIITKSAKDTQGGLVRVGGGVQERGSAAVRYGGPFGQKGHYRIYGNGFDRGPFAKGPDGIGTNVDGWHMFQGGFRTDWQLSNRDALTVEGDAYQGDQHQLIDSILLTPPFSQEAQTQTSLGGGHVLARWTRTFSPHSDSSLQFYYAGGKQNSPLLGSFSQSIDFDFQDRLALGARHDIVWGLGYRRTPSTFDNTFQVSFLPPSQALSLYSGFVQDEIAVVPERLHFIAGTKLEHVQYTGFNAQPNGRLLWTPSNKHTIWLSVAVAERTPDRADRGLDVNVAAFPGPGGSPAVLALLGDPNTINEHVLTYEVGYRTQPVRRLSLDLATFYSHYKDLSTSEPGTPFFTPNPAPGHLVIPLFFSNQMHGKGYGAELSVGWQVTNTWKLNLGYTALKVNLKPNPGSLDVTAAEAAENSPSRQIQLRSQWNLPGNFEFDQSVYSVSTIAQQQVPAYIRADLRFGWRPTDAMEISAIGQNLLSPRHLEFIDTEGNFSTQDFRKVFAKITWRF
jgi:iron complex outermembrane recepter protein